MTLVNFMRERRSQEEAQKASEIQELEAFMVEVAKLFDAVKRWTQDSMAEGFVRVLEEEVDSLGLGKELSYPTAVKLTLLVEETAIAMMPSPDLTVDLFVDSRHFEPSLIIWQYVSKHWILRQEPNMTWVYKAQLNKHGLDPSPEPTKERSFNESALLEFVKEALA